MKDPSYDVFLGCEFVFWLLATIIVALFGSSGGRYYAGWLLMLNGVAIAVWFGSRIVRSKRDDAEPKFDSPPIARKYWVPLGLFVLGLLIFGAVLAYTYR